MIIPMFKYGFLIYHQEYESFLNDLQQLGVLHVIEKDYAGSEDIRHKTGFVNQLEKTIQFLEKREKAQNDYVTAGDALRMVEEIIQKQEMLESLNQELNVTRKALQKAIPWGDFSIEIISRLKAEDLHVRFFMASKKKASGKKKIKN